MLFVKGLLMVVLLFTALFLIILVLLQRGKGGGLAGAFGGMGGQSAFGTKAGDMFTKITIGVATFWIVMCIITVRVVGLGSKGPLTAGAAVSDTPAVTAPPKTEKPAEGVKETPAPAPAEK